MKPKVILGTILILFSLIAGTYGAIHVFATNDRVDRMERRIDASDIYWIKKQLWQLEDRYGHLNCLNMNDMDKERCRELKAMIKKLEGSK